MNSIHNPTVKVKLRSGEVEMSELAWPAALKLYQRLMTQSRAFFDDQGQLVLDAGKVISAIQENVELGTWLVLESTGKDEDWLNGLSLSEALDVATEAAVLNIGIIVERVKNAKGRLRQIVAGEENPTSKLSASTGRSPT